MFVLTALCVGLWGLQYMADTESVSENFMSDQKFATQVDFINKQVAKARMGDAAMDIPTNPNPKNQIIIICFNQDQWLIFQFFPNVYFISIKEHLDLW
jgi:hypothetical protein